MMRYPNETVEDYNAFYSADYSDSAKRPSITIAYYTSAEGVEVAERATRTLTPPDVTGTITWTSSNTSVATVNSSGKVTGVKAGQALVTASVSGSIKKSYYVIANGSVKMRPLNGTTYAGTNVVVASDPGSPYNWTMSRNTTVAD